MTTTQVIPIVPAASSPPIVGSVTGTDISPVFTPQLGRDMYLTLTGTWVGSVQLQRSTDNRTTWNNVTIAGGQPWGLFTNNCDEVVDSPTDSDGVYRLKFNLTSGTINYRLGQ